MGNAVLDIRVFKDSKTIVIMDKFEKKGIHGEREYSSLLINDVFYIKYNRKLYSISLLLKRKERDVECISSTLTFTDLKKNLLEHVFTINDRNLYKILNEAFVGIKVLPITPEDKSFIYYLPKPVVFNAQNSSNRSGYGNRCCGEELTYEGTLYGETTEYMFTEIRYKRC